MGVVLAMFSDIRLTVDNICSRIREVDSIELGKNLRVPPHKLNGSYSTQAERTRATIGYWLSTDPNPSWRRLMMALVENNELTAMENVNRCVEKPIGKHCSFTVQL